ncbi:MAG TPA: glycogen debranching N-terminal domain-containing protein [Candidatus Acidoferrales bacterium]|nr:glycogen debranching N-terminal domain-containing protein [Candidatus Acidoferrales bacterium]
MKKLSQTSVAKITPRPGVMLCSQGRAVLATNPSGTIADSPKQGLFYAETRVLSQYEYLIDGKPPQMIAVSNVEQHSWLGYYIFPPPGAKWKKDTGSGEMEEVSEETVELKVSRTVGYGVHEDIDFTNFSDRSCKFLFNIAIGADFADQAETFRRKQHGSLRTRWKPGARNGELHYEYRNQHHYSHQGNRGVARLQRGLIVRIEKADSTVSFRESKLSFPIFLAPGASWHTCIKLIPVFDGKKILPLYDCRQFFGSRNELDRKRLTFLNESTSFATLNKEDLSATVESALRQAKADLASLRMPDMDHAENSWVMAAGLPIYIALFGRDTLTVGWQTASVSSAMMRGTLQELPEWQGKTENDWRDEQPGRMLHEAHTGPLATLYYNPRTRYYGAATPSSFYPVVLSELWRWTGDRKLVEPLIKPALAGLRWKDNYTDLFGDGFYAYQTLSSQGNKNQGWKDSGDAIVYEDGRQVDTPISTCEEQAFVYVAKIRMSEMFWFLGDKTQARQIFDEATELRKRFNDKFWMPEKKFYALGLDPNRRQIKSISSNPGHLLTCGIVPEDLAATVARRLLRPDMFSGWGVRTLSSDHPAFDPYSYHRGSVWPVEHGSFAMGMMRYGLIDELHTIARGMFEATTLFHFNRLPECFGGQQRDSEHPFPALYPKANWPQAWSCSSLFAIVQAMLGLYPFAPMNLLLLDPQLPDWLPEITLRNLHVGRSVASIRFYRKGQRTHFDVVEKRGTLHVLRQPSPWSLTAGVGERIKDVMESLIP